MLLLITLRDSNYKIAQFVSSEIRVKDFFVNNHNQPNYILDLLLSAINLGFQPAELVESLPKLELER